MNRRESLKLIASATTLISFGGGYAWAQTPPPGHSHFLRLVMRLTHLSRTLTLKP